MQTPKPTRRRAKVDSPADAGPTPQPEARLIKKYPNRRLYDTKTSSYVTLVDIRRMILAYEAFRIHDAKTGNDVTRSMLLQIILDAETAGMPMFSEAALANLIRFYGNNMQGIFGSYFEQNMQALLDVQRRATGALGSVSNPVQVAGLPSMVGTYVEQSQVALRQMNERLQEQAAQVLKTFGSLR